MGHSATLEIRSENGVVTITMNRPDKRNALNPAMIEDLTGAFIAAGNDPSCGETSGYDCGRGRAGSMGVSDPLQNRCPAPPDITRFRRSHRAGSRQTGFLMDHREVTDNPFFLIAPHWAVIPLVGVATLATIIASQAIITGSFSMTRQAMQLGWLPGMTIRQTSDHIYGEIYVPVVNWILMFATVLITITFGTSDRLAGAYGTAVAKTMLLTTLLL